VAAEARQQARRADERDVAVEREAARPAAWPRDGDEVVLLTEADLAVAAVVDPDRAVSEPRRVGAGEPADDRLPRRAGEDDTPSIDREVAMPGTARRDDVGRRGEVRRAHAPAGGDRVELEVIPLEDRSAPALHAAGPPDDGCPTVVADADDGVPPDGVRVEPSADHREVVDVRPAGEEAGSDGNERAMRERR